MRTRKEIVEIVKNSPHTETAVREILNLLLDIRDLLSRRNESFEQRMMCEQAEDIAHRKEESN